MSITSQSQVCPLHCPCASPAHSVLRAPVYGVTLIVRMTKNGYRASIFAVKSKDPPSKRERQGPLSVELQFCT